MLILLDENLLSKKLKKLLVDAGHLVENVEDMGESRCKRPITFSFC